MGHDVFSGKKSIGDRAKYIVKPPGWKHDGTGKMSDDLRREWQESVGSVQSSVGSIQSAVGSPPASPKTTFGQSVSDKL